MHAIDGLTHTHTFFFPPTQARVLEHLESLMTFTPNLAAVAGGQFDDADDAAGAVAEGQNGHNVEGEEGEEQAQ